MWRMAFRSGNQGFSVWDQCLRLGVGAITYPALADVDLREYAEYEPSEKWRELSPTQRYSLAQVAYRMQGGDVIFVKQGPEIVSKGVILGNPGHRAYRFDESSRITDRGGEVWRHQVPVKWAADFDPVRCLIGTSQQFTVQALDSEHVARLELAPRAEERPDPALTQRLEFLSEESYYRECPERLNVIVRLHNKLSNAFKRWVREKAGRRHDARAKADRHPIQDAQQDGHG